MNAASGLPTLPDDHALIKALEAMNRIGITDLGGFLAAFLASEHPRVQKKADQFMQNSFEQTMIELMERSYYGSSRRRTAKRIEKISGSFGKQLIDWIAKILLQEIKEAALDPRAKLPPSDLKPHHVLDFSFRHVETLFAQCAPLTFRLISALCSVRDGEHVGQQTYLSNVGMNSELPDSADDLIDIEEGWDEGDPWYDDCPLATADFVPPEMPPTGHSQCTSNNVLPGGSKSQRISQQRRQRDSGISDNVTSSHARKEGQPCRGQKRRRPRRIRNRAIIAVTVLAQILYAYSQRANAFQTMIAAYSFASRTGKRVTAVLNQLGLSVSPTTFGNALKQNAAAASTVVKSGIQAGRKIGLFYDNLVIYDKKAEESEINKNRSLQLTACGGYFLQLPLEKAESINSAHDPTLNLRPRNQCPQGSSSMGDLDSCGQNHSVPSLPQGTLLDEDGLGISESEFDPLDSPSSDGKPIHLATGIQSELLLRPNPDYSKIQTLDIINSESQIYYEEAVKGHLCILLRKHFDSEIRANMRKDLLKREYIHKTLFQIPVVKSEIFTLPTLDLDESTIDGNAAILESIVSSLGFTLDGLCGTTIPISGDQMTLGRIRSVQELRVRDRPAHQARFAAPWMGFLHFGFASADVIKRCNTGLAGGGDPGSLSTFVQLLGRTGILDSKPNFNATHRLVEEIGEAFNLAAFFEIAQVKTMGDLQRWVSTEDWVDLVDQVYKEYFLLSKVGVLRANAIRKATMAYEKRLEAVHAVRPAQRSQSQLDFLALPKRKYIQDESDKLRDLTYENSLLFMQQIMLHHDFYTAMRKGDSGRLEKSLELYLVLFEGAGKNNYAQELLEQQIDRKVLWKPYMRSLWQRNCLLNISGAPNKFLAVDEVCEYLVRQLKSSYNPRNTWQSKEFHMETLSRLTMLFRDVRRVVVSSSGAPSFGTRHSQVDSAQDISFLLKNMNGEELLVYQEGRSRISKLHNARRVTESLDAWTVGQMSYATGAPLARALGKRMEIQIASKEYSSPLSLDQVGWGFGLEGQDGARFLSTEELEDPEEGGMEFEFDIYDSDSSSDSDF